MNKLIFLITLLVGFISCSPEQPSKPGPGPKPPVVEELGPTTSDVLLDRPE